MAQKLSFGKLYLFVLLLSLTITFLFIIACEDKIPNESEEPEPGRREYAWYAETLKVGGSGLVLGRLWGASENDIWAYGWGNSRMQLWHYYEGKWRTDSLNRGVLEAGDMIGFSRDNVWITSTNDGSIWQYNGSYWKKIFTPDYPGYNRIVYNGIWGRNENDIYAGGFAQNTFTYESFGIIAHYNGTQWQKIDIPKVDNISYNQIVYDQKSNIYIVAAIEFIDDILYEKLFTFDRKVLTEFYSEISSSPEIFIVDDELYIVIGSHRTIYKYERGGLKKVIDFQNTPFRRFMVGRSKNDFFTFNYNGLGHYNGTDLQTIFETENLIEGIWVNQKTVFVIMRDNPTFNFIMLRGELLDK